MGTRTLISLLAIVLVLAVVWMSIFFVDERQLAIKFRLGEIVRSDYEPGLHFKLPIVNNVRKFDSRILTLDSDAQKFLTGEKKNVLVDYFVKWRIGDVEAFYRSFGGSERTASLRLAETIRNALQAELGNRTINEVVSGERREIMRELADHANEELSKFGIVIVDVRVKQIELPDEVRESVYGRMRAERERIAKEHRAEGEKAAAIIRAQANRKKTELLAEAQRKAEQLRGEGDAEATRIYAEAYTQDPKFYEFYRSLQAYRKSFNSKQDVLVLEPDSLFFEYFGQAGASAP